MPLAQNQYLRSPVVTGIALTLGFVAAISLSLVFIGQKISESKSLDFINKRGEGISATVSARINNALSASSNIKLEFSGRTSTKDLVSTEHLVEMAARYFNDDSVNVEISKNDESLYYKDNMGIGADKVELMGQRSVNTNGVISSVSLYKDTSKDSAYITVTTQIDSSIDRQTKLSVSFWLIQDRTIRSNSASDAVIATLKNSDARQVYGFIDADDVEKIVKGSSTGNSLRGYSVFKATVVGDLDLFFVEKNNDFLVKYIDFFIAHIVLCLMLIFIVHYVIVRYFYKKELASTYILERSLTEMEKGSFSLSDITNSGRVNPKVASALSRHWMHLAKAKSSSATNVDGLSSRNELEFEKGLAVIEQHISSSAIQHGNLLIVCLKIEFTIEGALNALELQRTVRDLIAVAVFDTKLNNGTFSVFMSDIGVNFFEFIISVPNCSTTRHLLRIIESVESKFSSDDLKQIQTCAFGHSVYPNHGVTSSELVKNALLSVNMQTNDKTWSEERAKIGLIGLYFKDFDLSKNKSDMSILYHPIFDVDLRRVSGVEALVRFEIPGIGSVSPEKFIDIAALNQKMYEIDLHVLSESCATLVLLKNTGLRHIGLSVNFSSETLRAADCVDKIAAILTATGFNPQNLCIEIPENVFTIEDGVLAHNISSLKNMGASIVADNFYKNKSMMFSLNGFPIDYIKLNLSSLGLSGSLDNFNLTVIEGIIATSKKLNICTVVCGVESEAQYQALKGAGCKMVQGFMLGKPVQAHRLSETIKTNLSEIYDFK